MLALLDVAVLAIICFEGLKYIVPCSPAFRVAGERPHYSNMSWYFYFPHSVFFKFFVLFICVSAYVVCLSVCTDTCMWDHQRPAEVSVQL